MKSKRARIEERIFQAAAERKQQREDARKGRDLDQAIPQDAMGKILGMPATSANEAPEMEPAQQLGDGALTLLLAEGLRGPETNFTKYPNEMHDLASAELDTNESIAYMRLWRDSWGYGRNYCRIGYGGLLRKTSIRSRNSAIAAVKGLKEKKFIALVLGSDGRPFTSQDGTIYRVFTPQEVISGHSAEGIPLSGIPLSGIPVSGTPKNRDSKPNQKGVSPPGIPQPGIPGADSTSVRYTGVPERGIPQSDTPEENLDTTGDVPGIPQSGIPGTGTLIKKERKDTLSPDLIIDLFYTGIGQGKISNEKRERALKCIQELKEENFSEEDIACAAEWTPVNTREKLYDFAIIKHTIGQALAAREKEELANEAKQEKARVAAEMEEKEQSERQERNRLEEEKGKLPAEERKRLRLRAEQQLKDSGDFKPEYITEALIASKENEIFREDGVT